MQRGTVACLMCLTAIFWLTGCGGGGDGGDGGTGDQGGAGGAAGQTSGTSPTVISRPAYLESEYRRSDFGQFKVVWPSGCDKIHNRTWSPPDSDEEGVYDMVHIYCAREDRKHEGCAVTVHFSLKGEDGGPPTPGDVISLVESAIAKYGVKIERQRPIQKGPFSGVQVQCQKIEDPGQVWLEGLLHESTIYIQSAWKLEGGLFEDREYQTFFDSFRLPSEDADTDPAAGRSSPVDTIRAGGVAE